MQPEIYPVMLTPFNNDDTVDLVALKELTEFYINSGSDGLFVNCLSGEMFQLSIKERLLITKTVVEQSRNRQHVISTGTFGYRLNEHVDFIKKMHQTGADIVVINTSQIIKTDFTEEKFKTEITKILDNTENIPLGLYECPVPEKRILSPELTGWLARTGRFVYLKETSCDLELIKRKIESAENTLLQIFNANIPTASHSLRYGISGISSIASNFYPELLHFLVKNYKSTDDRITKLNSFITVADRLLHHKYPYSAKYFLRQRGMKLNLKTRSVKEVFEPQDYLLFDELQRMMQLIAAEIGINIVEF